jgi:Cu/Ag efflux protein CusF
VNVWTCDLVNRTAYKRVASKNARKKSQAKAEVRALHVSSKLQALAKKALDVSMRRAQRRLTKAEEDYRRVDALTKKIQVKLDKITAARERSLTKLRKVEDRFDTAVSAAMC